MKWNLILQTDISHRSELGRWDFPLCVQIFLNNIGNLGKQWLLNHLTNSKDVSVATSVMVLCPVCVLFIPCGDPKASSTSFKLRCKNISWSRLFCKEVSTWQYCLWQPWVQNCEALPYSPLFIGLILGNAAGAFRNVPIFWCLCSFATCSPWWSSYSFSQSLVDV